MNTVPPEHFCQTIAVNVDNEKLSDADFRQFIRNTLPIVDFELPKTHEEKSKESGTKIDRR